MPRNLILFLFFLLIIPVVTGETYKQFSNIEFVEVIRVEGYPSDNILANITITDPDNIVLVGFDKMTYNSSSKTFNYTLSGSRTSKTGTYSRCISATSIGLNQTECFAFDVTPSGKSQGSILNNTFLILFGLLGFGLLVFGIYQGNPWFGFISSVLFLLGGIYVFIYGINNEQNLYSQSISIIFIGSGIIFMFLSAFEVIWGGNNSEEEED